MYAEELGETLDQLQKSIQKLSRTATDWHEDLRKRDAALGTRMANLGEAGTGAQRELSRSGTAASTLGESITRELDALKADIGPLRSLAQSHRERLDGLGRMLALPVTSLRDVAHGADAGMAKHGDKVRDSCDKCSKATEDAAGTLKSSQEAVRSSFDDLQAGLAAFARRVRDSDSQCNGAFRGFAAALRGLDDVLKPRFGEMSMRLQHHVPHAVMNDIGGRISLISEQTTLTGQNVHGSLVEFSGGLHSVGSILLSTLRDTLPGTVDHALREEGRHAVIRFAEEEGESLIVAKLGQEYTAAYVHFLPILEPLSLTFKILVRL